MDFAIAPMTRAAARPPGASWESGVPECDWAVLWIHECRGAQVAERLAHFGHRSHAEAFLADLLRTAGSGAGLRED